MKVNLDGKVAVITGAARGIGYAIAEAMADNGAQVIMADIDKAGAHAASDRIPNSKPLRMDVTDQAEVEAGIQWVKSEFGHIDILVNNAGINTAKSRVTVDKFSVEEWDLIMNVDLRGLFLVSRAASAIMAEQGEGRIVNISSVLGVVPARLQCAFTAAKAGVVNLTRAMAIELAQRGVLVNCIAPGSILTDGTKSLFYGKEALMSDRAGWVKSQVPMGRPGSVDEVAAAVLFFSAPESSYITGQTLCVDGGWTAGGFLREF
jgi:3-oxoacyl-[acyl-carrier protein] reductase